MGKEARSELVDALRERYRSAPREAKGRIIEEFVAVSGVPSQTRRCAQSGAHP